MFASAWQRFVAASTTFGPTAGAREAWARGRSRYAVWLLRVDDDAVCHRLAAAADRLCAHGVPVPFAEPHVTVFVAGFPAAVPVHDDDIDEDVLREQVAALTAGAPLTPRLFVGGLNAFLSCPILEVHDPHGDLAALRTRLEAGAREIRFAPYLPHLTVGVFADSRPTGPIATAIAPHRHLPLLPLGATAIELVSFDAAVPFGPLTTEARVPFRPR
jgi:hypothetical protein